MKDKKGYFALSTMSNLNYKILESNLENSIPPFKLIPTKKLLELPPEEELPNQNYPSHVPHNFPYNCNAVFTGREEELKEIAHNLLYTYKNEDNLEQQARGIVISGFAGLGKSQLATEFCYHYSCFFHGVYWIQANLDIETKIAEYGKSMELPGWHDSISQQVEFTLKAWRECGCQLIVLDNAELEVIDDWLQKLYPARLLITSLRTKWPADLKLHVTKLKVFERKQSRELLRKLATKLENISDEELDKIAICFGDLPLALDLAGRYLNDRSELFVVDYLIELKNARSTLKHESLMDWAEHSPTKYSINLAAAFSLSWDLVTKDDELAKMLFKMGGYCAPNTPIPRQLLEEALGPEIKNMELDRALHKLNNLGLMILDTNGCRMHILLAEFARLKDIDTKGELDPSGVLVHLATCYISIFRKHKNDYKNLNIHKIHVLTVQSACFKAKEWSAVRKLTWAISEYMGWMGYWKDRIKVIEAGVDAADKDGTRSDKGAFLNMWGATYQFLGKYDQSIEKLEQALDIAREINDPHVKGAALA